MNRRRVVITGIGMVSPLGHSFAATLAALHLGESGVAPATLFDAGGFAEDCAAEVKNFEPRTHFRIPKAIKLTDRATRFAVAAAAMALEHAEWPRDETALERLGVVIGSSGSDLQAQELARALEPDPASRSVADMSFFAERILSGLTPLWLLIALPNMPSAHVAIQLGARGPNSTIMTDWVAGSQAIGEAVGWIREGGADAVLAGGADTAVQPFAYSSYEQAGLLKREVGGGHRFVPGEGAAVVLLEERAQARRRGAPILGEITAYAAASSPVGPADNALARTMSAALAEAGWRPRDIGTIGMPSVFAPSFLELEETALEMAMGPPAAAVVKAEFRSRLGHALAASGPLDLGLLLGTRAAGGAILCNSLGYSGQAVTLAVLPGEEAVRDGLAGQTVRQRSAPRLTPCTTKLTSDAPPHRRRVVITGLGILSAGGCEPHAFWHKLVAGTSSVRRIRRFDVSAFPSQLAAEIDDVRLRDLAGLSDEWRKRGRIAEYAAAAAARAIDDADLSSLGPRIGVGVAVAAGMGRYDHEEVFAPCAAARSSNHEFDWEGFTERLLRLARPCAAERRTPGSIPALIAHQHGFRGPVMAVMTACAGGTQAIGDALRWIRTGRAGVVLAGGSDSELYPMGLASFCLLGALSRRNDAPAAASRPFDAQRDGFVLGEGAGMLVLEDRDLALRRGARIYAEVAGFGSACDSYRVTDPHPDGAGAVLAMTRAIADAGLSPPEIDYINAHGTSTPANDRIETLAIRKVFGARAPQVPISSTKSLIGHAIVAAGAVEAIATALTLTHQIIHPTINQETPDPACDLDYVPNRARVAPVEHALSNSFAFGGQSASLVLRRHHA